MGLAQVPVNYAGDVFECFIDGIAVLDDDVFGLIGGGCEPDGAFVVSIEEAIREESLVIRAVSWCLGRQLGDEVGGELPPLGAGNDGGFAPAVIGLRHVRQPLVPAEQGRMHAVSAAWHAQMVPMSAECLHTAVVREVKLDLLASGKDARRRGVTRCEVAPLIERLLAGGGGGVARRGGK